MKLQILVTQYKETEEVIKPLLDSIAIQQSVDFREIGVVVCNDGSDVILSTEFLDRYPFDIDYLLGSHTGVSGARNALLHYATADYVMFCDADDMFVNNCGLYIIFLNIAQGFDTLNSAFIEEAHAQPTQEVVYITHENDGTFIHGKVHRRQYLLDNDIWWNEKLTIHEDSFFNIQCLNFTTKVKYCSMPFYLWKFRADSVCRNDPKYMLKTYGNLIDSNDALIDAFLKRGVMDKAMFHVAHMIFDAYYTMNKPEWINQENREYRDATEARFADYYKKHSDLWDAVPMYDKVQISNKVREKVIKEGMQMEAVTVFAWLKQIKGEEICLQENKENC